MFLVQVQEPHTELNVLSQGTDISQTEALICCFFLVVFFFVYSLMTNVRAFSPFIPSKGQT